MPATLLARTLALAVAIPIAAVAQRPEPSAADSALIGRILSAEDRRDSSDAALAEGLRHGDVRVRVVATRALGRIRDPRFVARDSLPALPSPPSWPEPAWRLRYRALTASCDSLDAALADSALPVRLRAADLAAPACASDTLLVSTLRRWADALSVTGTDRARGRETWHAVAHALVALARLDADDARARIAAAEPEAVVVCAFGALIKEPLLSDHELINVHPSLLARWRGAAPVERAIMAGEIGRAHV